MSKEKDLCGSIKKGSFYFISGPIVNPWEFKGVSNNCHFIPYFGCRTLRLHSSTGIFTRVYEWNYHTERSTVFCTLCNKLHTGCPFYQVGGRFLINFILLHLFRISSSSSFFYQIQCSSYTIFKEPTYFLFTFHSVSILITKIFLPLAFWHCRSLRKYVYVKLIFIPCPVSRWMVGNFDSFFSYCFCGEEVCVHYNKYMNP